MPYRRRMYRRRRPRNGGKNIQHITSLLNSSPANNTQSTHLFANAGNYNVTHTANTTIVGALSNREQENTIGNHIGATTIDFTVRQLGTTQGIVEYCVFKLERQQNVPVAGTGLPTDARITAVGLQTAMREAMPGRVLHYGQVAITAELAVVRRLRIKWSKYKMSKMRGGDFYGIVYFNRGGGTDVFIDTQTRYKEYV